MKVEHRTVDFSLYHDLIARFLAFAAHVEDKEVNIKPPKLESIYIVLHMILSGLKNAGIYKPEEIAEKLDELARHFRLVEGPKR